MNTIHEMNAGNYMLTQTPESKWKKKLTRRHTDTTFGQDQQKETENPTW